METDACSVPIETIFSHATTGGEIDALATLTRHVTILCRSDPLQTKGLMDFISSSIATGKNPAALLCLKTKRSALAHLYE